MEFRAGPLSVAVWRKPVQEENRTFYRYSIRVRIYYKDPKTSEYRYSEYLFPEELSKLNLILLEMYEALTLTKNEDGFDPKNCEEVNDS
jgi:hypothetical protein